MGFLDSGNKYYQQNITNIISPGIISQGIILQEIISQAEMARLSEARGPKRAGPGFKIQTRGLYGPYGPNLA